MRPTVAPIPMGVMHECFFFHLKGKRVNMCMEPTSIMPSMVLNSQGMTIIGESVLDPAKFKGLDIKKYETENIYPVVQIMNDFVCCSCSNKSVCMTMECECRRNNMQCDKKDCMCSNWCENK
jgi:hypothetical protein